METIRQKCPQCQAMLELPASAVGRTARCPACQHTFTVPSPASPPPTATPSGSWPQPWGGSPAGSPQADPFSQRDQAPGYSTASSGGRSPSGAGASNPYAMTAAGAIAEPTKVHEGDLVLQTPSIDQIVSDTTGIFTARWQMLVIGGLVSFGFGIVNYVAQQILSMLAMALGELGAIIPVLAQIIGGLAGMYLTIGLIRVALASSRGEEAPFTMLFPDLSTFRRCIWVMLIPILVALVLGGLLAAIGAAIYAVTQTDEVLVALVIVGSVAGTVAYLAAFFFLWPALYVATDNRARGIEALRLGYSIVSINKLNTFLLILISMVLGFVGLMMCCVGQIITTPITMLVGAVGYLLMTGQPLVNPSLTPKVYPNYGYGAGGYGQPGGYPPQGYPQQGGYQQPNNPRNPGGAEDARES